MDIEEIKEENLDSPLVVHKKKMMPLTKRLIQR